MQREYIGVIIPMSMHPTLVNPSTRIGEMQAMYSTVGLATTIGVANSVLALLQL